MATTLIFKISLSFVINNNSYLYLLKRYVKCGYEERAVQIYEEMKDKYKIKPDFITTSCIIGHLVKIWNIEKVFEIITPFIHTNPNEEILWVILLHSCSELKDIEKCNRLFEVWRKMKLIKIKINS